MIKYAGIKGLPHDKVCFLKFENERGYFVEVPLDKLTASRIEKYLTKISEPLKLREEQEKEELGITEEIEL